MSKRSINYKKNRRKLKRSSPGGTPGPLGRIQQIRDASEIARELNGLILANRKSLKKENSEAPPPTPSNLLQQSTKPPKQQGKLLPTATELPAAQLAQQRQQAKIQKRDEDPKFECSSSIGKSPTCLTVKQRAQLFEKVTTCSNAAAPARIQKPGIKKVTFAPCQTIIGQEGRGRRTGTPRPRKPAKTSAV